MRQVKIRKKLKYLWHDFSNIYNRYFTVTSDDFFHQHAGLLRAEPPQVIFIDGMHSFQQVLADCYHALNYLAKDGVIILHDCSPPHAMSATPATSPQDAMEKWKQRYPDRKHEWTGEWCGDTWKAIPYLIKHHPELNVCVLNADYGLGMVSRKRGTDLVAKYGEFADTSQFEKMDYAVLDKNRPQMLNLKKLSELKSVMDMHC